MKQQPPAPAERVPPRCDLCGTSTVAGYVPVQVVTRWHASGDSLTRVKEFWCLGCAITTHAASPHPNLKRGAA